MTTSAVSASKPKIDGRGKHPNSLKNLKPPWPPGFKPPGAGGETVSHSLKDILREMDSGRSNARAIAEKMVERAKILTGKPDAAILNQVLDRTEGKVPQPISGDPDNPLLLQHQLLPLPALQARLAVLERMLLTTEALPPGQVVEGEVVEGEG